MSENATPTVPPAGNQAPQAAGGEQRRYRYDILLVGLVLIGLGVLLLYVTLYPEVDLRELARRYWPLLLVAAGLVKVVQSFLGVSGRGSGIGLLIVAAVIIFILVGVPWEWIDFEGFVFAHRFESGRSITVAEGQVLTVYTNRADVRVYGYGGDDIEVSLLKYVRVWDRERARDIAGDFDIQVSESESGLLIAVDPEGRTSSSRLRAVLELRIPRRVLHSIRTVRGDIEVEGVSSDFEIESRYGDVEVSRASGLVGLTLGDGDVELFDLTGGVELDGRHADVELDEVYGPIRLELERGNIELENGRPVRGDMQIRTGRGRIDLELSEDSDVTVEADAPGGRISIDFLHVDINERGRQQVRRSFNDGDYTLRLETARGLIRIEEN